MNQSTNYNFNLPEGTDLVNLLTQLIPNWSSLDTILKGIENQAFTNCTEVTSLGVHAISRTNSEGKILKWIATSNFTAGETFTVDGNVVAAATPAGSTLATGAYVTGSIVIAALNSDESAMTVFVSGTNVATDSERLGGELPSYYAKQSDMENAQTDITDLDNLMGNTSISAIGDGTVTGAISLLNTNQGSLKFRINSGVAEYSIDGGITWIKLGGGSMPKLNYTTPLHTFSTGNLSYTATKECYIVGSLGASRTLTINSRQYSVSAANTANQILLKISAGDIVTVNIGIDCLHILEELI